MTRVLYVCSSIVTKIEKGTNHWWFELANMGVRFSDNEKPPFDEGDLVKITMEKTPIKLPETS